jgi:Zn-finger protein
MKGVGLILFGLLLLLSADALAGPMLRDGGGNGQRWNCQECSQIHSRETRECLRFSTLGEQNDCYRRATEVSGSCWRNCDYK